MTDKELIKQEIEKEIGNIKRYIYHPSLAGHSKRDMTVVYETLNKLLQFIDSLPEEPKKQPKFKVGDTIKGPCNNIFQVKEVLDKQYLLHSENGDELNSIEIVDKYSCISEEPASEDLEEEISNYIKDNFFGSGSIGFLSNRTKGELDSVDVANIARHFAEWQKERDYLQYSHIRLKDIKDAWQTLKKNKPDIESYPPICFVKGAEWQKQQMKEALQTEYEKGRFDMREEMMKDAVETTIVNDWQYGKDPDHAVIPAIHQRIKEFTVGDRVKIFIVKEE